MTSAFLLQGDSRPVFGGNPLFQGRPDWRDNILFYEYFNAETGKGLGASHQTGWTALVAKLIQQGAGNSDVSPKLDVSSEPD